MAELVQLPTSNGAPHDEGAGVRHIPRFQHRFYAFLSYSHRDEALADWLHRELERFHVSRSLAGRLTATGVIPKRLSPVFRDRHELAAADDLGAEIKAALASSQFLIVLCSPDAARSRWVNAEIEAFKRTRPEGCVLAAIASGEPFASEMPGRQEEECFPPALRQKYDRRGRSAGRRAEPLAADFREEGDGRRNGLLKLVAGMLGVGLDDLVRREATRRQRRLGYLAAASIAGMAVTSTLAVVAIQARDAARDQRREAEGLIAFMLGDLKDKLEPIGRLDALDGVGSRVLAYYSKQDTGALSDAALRQRSRALSLMAQVANARGDVDGSLKLYREAIAGTAETIRRRPNDAQAIFDHAQNVFYVGEIARVRGDYRTAEDSMREYKRLALRMVALQPDSMKFRMEQQYAEFNLGVVLNDQHRFAEAAAQFRKSLATIEAIATADPDNKDYGQSVAESFAWLADAERAVGNYPAAIDARRRGIAVLEQLSAATGDVDYQSRLIEAQRSLGIFYAERGQSDLAVEQFIAAVDKSAALIPKEPANTQWLEYASWARLGLAQQLLLSGKKDEAAAQTDAACQALQSLLKRNAVKPLWRSGLARCWNMKARISLASGATDVAVKQAQAALDVSKSVRSGDSMADGRLAAGAYRLLGDIQRQSGNVGAAYAAWNSALAALPKSVVERPDEMAEHAAILQRLGRNAEAQQLAAKLNSMGYRASA